MKRHTWILGWAILSALVLSCGGVPPTYYYRIDSEDHKPAHQNNDVKIPISLGVAQFTTDLLYETDKIVYRDSPYEVQFYHYRRWIAPPKKIVTESIYRQFRDSGSFERVMSLPAPHKIDYLLRGRVLAFEEWDEANAWYGLVTLEFSLQDPDSKETVWSDVFSEKTPAQKKEPVEVVKAINASLNAVVADAIEAIKNHLRQYKL